jgi:uncharacterized Zn finger protein
VTEPPEPVPRPAIAAADLYCESCDRETPHRVLRVLPGRATKGVVRGIARCRVCQWTHPFESRGEATDEVALVLSDGGRSAASRIRLPAHRRVLVGSGLAGQDPRVRVRRIDRTDGTSVPEARAEEIATVWATREPDPFVKVSIVQGRRTVTDRLPVPRPTEFEVGARVLLDRRPLWIAALRARGHTWRRVGDRFPSDEVNRLYLRTTEIPPAGSNDWSVDRGSSSDSERDRSTDARSRSSPGRTRTRTSPRARTADSGAAVHRRRPS